MRRAHVIRVLPALLPTLLTACGTPPAGDDAAIVRATLTLLESGRSPDAPALCVDSRPRGEPLAIYRTMRINSEPDEGL